MNREIETSTKKFPDATPRPWRINGATFIWSPDGHSNVAAVSDPRPPNNSSVGYYEMRPWDASDDADRRFREACANAELITEAVNSYDALREAAIEARDVLALLVPYGKIHTVEGVKYPDGSHSEAVDRGERVLNRIRDLVDGKQITEEAQGNE